MTVTSSPPRRSERDALPRRNYQLMAVIVLCLLAFLLAKAQFGAHQRDPLFYAYGLTVTAVVIMQMVVAFFVYRDPCRLRPIDTSLAASPPVSCLVAVHNDEHIIAACLRSLCSQTYLNREIIVVNDASTDGTQAVIDALAAELPIRSIELTRNVGKKAALAEAILIARGYLLAFTDSDSTWEPTCLERIVPVFLANSDVGAVSGHCRARNADATWITRVQDTWYQGQFAVRKAFESAFGAVTCVSGPLAVFRRAAIFNVIPAWVRDEFLGDEFRFATDRTLTGYVLGGKGVAKRLIAQTPEDSPFLSVRYRTRKWRIVYSKSANALTEVPRTFSKLVRQQVRWKKSFLRNMFLTGRFYWRRPLPVAANYYLHILFVVIGPFVALRHLVLLPLRGNIVTMFLYIIGISVVGSAFGLAHKAEEPDATRWVYRPIMSLMSTLVFSWLLFYSIATIKRMTWSRG